MTVTDRVEAAAWACIRDRRVLVVRAAGSDAFYLPGGKPEPGESDVQAAVREVTEEVRMVIDPASLRLFREIVAPAHRRPPGTQVRLACFVGGDDGAQSPERASEIAEVGWFTSAESGRCAPAIRLLIAELVDAGLID